MNAEIHKYTKNEDIRKVFTKSNEFLAGSVVVISIILLVGFLFG